MLLRLECQILSVKISKHILPFYILNVLRTICYKIINIPTYNFAIITIFSEILLEEIFKLLVIFWVFLAGVGTA